MMAGDFDIERDAAAPDAAVEEPELVAISCIARPSPRKKWILAAVATVLLIAAVAAGLGAGLSNGKGEEETNPTTGTKDPPSRETAALPSPSLPANVSETAGSGIVPNATDPVSSVADSPTSANANALMTSYNIFWKETASKCYAKNKEHLARIECPSLMLFYNGDNCEAIDEKSIVCSGEEVGKTGVVEVACVGTTIDELLVDVNVAGSTYVCNESERDVSSNGLQFTQYVDGTVSQITTVLAKDCDEQPPLSCSGTYSLKVGDDAFKGCGSMMKCANSKTCLIGFPTSCFGLYCQDSLDDVQYQVAGLSDQCTSPFSIGAIPNGESCEYNVECSSKVCSFGTCQDPLIDEAACEESSDCSSQACAYKDASYTERICCLDGEATTSSSGAAVCLGSADAGADCDGQNAICKDNTCAYVDYDRQETVCCGSGSFKYKQCSVCGESDYCLNQAPTGASCGTLDQMCESEVCAGAKCQAGKLSAGEGCNNAEDCLSGSCGIVDYNGRNDRTAKVCCASGSFKYKQCSVCGESDYCLKQAPTGASCGKQGNVPRMCESETCKNGFCK